MEVRALLEDLLVAVDDAVVGPVGEAHAQQAQVHLVRAADHRRERPVDVARVDHGRVDGADDAVVVRERVLHVRRRGQPRGVAPGLHERVVLALDVAEVEHEVARAPARRVPDVLPLGVDVAVAVRGLAAVGEALPHEAAELRLRGGEARELAGLGDHAELREHLVEGVADDAVRLPVVRVVGRHGRGDVARRRVPEAARALAARVPRRGRHVPPVGVVEVHAADLAVRRLERAPDALDGRARVLRYVDEREAPRRVPADAALEEVRRLLQERGAAVVVARRRAGAEALREAPLARVGLGDGAEEAVHGRAATGVARRRGGERRGGDQAAQETRASHASRAVTGYDRCDVTVREASIINRRAGRPCTAWCMVPF